MRHSGRVLIWGAAGGMGRRVARLLRDLLPGVRLRLGVRRRSSFEEFANWPDIELVSICREDSDSLRASLAGVAVVINAMGPYIYDPAPLLELCQAAGAAYVGLASEPAFLDAARAWGSRPEVQIAVCAGASTIPGLIEISSRHLGERLAVTPAGFEIFFSMGSVNPLTAGMLASMTLPLGLPLGSDDGAVAYRQLRAHELPGLGKRLFGRFPTSFDRDGLRAGESRVPARFWVGFDRAWIVHALRAFFDPISAR